MRIDAQRIHATARERGWMTGEEARLLEEYRSRPAPVEDVAPWLRFLLESEAVADGQRFYKDIYQLALVGRDAEGFIERQFIGRMEERWPAVAAADREFGGKISAVLRKAARARGQIPGWYGFAHGLSIGHPQGVESLCEHVLGASARFETYSEEAAYPRLMRASGAVGVRDVTDEREEEDCPF